MAKTLGIPKEKVRLMSPYIGGGFGGKLWIRADAVLAALGARAARRPVKVGWSAPSCPTIPSTVRPPCSASASAPRRTARSPPSPTRAGPPTSPGGSPEAAAVQTRSLYAGPNRMTANRLVTLDLPEHNAMRAPNEAPGLAALEIAIDEMAEKLGMDPVEFRIVNDTQVVPDNPPAKPQSADPQSKAAAPKPKHDPHPPFSQGSSSRCLRQGARDSAGTSAARSQPRARRALARRHGRGHGLSRQPRDEIRGARAPRPAWHGDRRDRHDRHRHRQLHGDRADRRRVMGVALENVVVRLGDSAFPVSCGSGGQWAATARPPASMRPA